MLGGIAHLHSKGLIWTDAKPANFVNFFNEQTDKIDRKMVDFNTVVGEGERVTAATDEHAPPEYHAKEPPRADESFDEASRIEQLLNDPKVARDLDDESGDAN